jgi:hypothetical protein
MPELRRAAARLLAPDQGSLRLPADALAEAFLGMVPFGARMPDRQQSPLPAEQIVDVFLHGALVTTQ